MGWWLLLGLAYGQEPAVGGFELRAGPRARVQTLPMVSATRQQWVIHESAYALNDQLSDSLFIPGVEAIDLYGVGGGSWMVTLQLTEPGLVGSWREEAGAWVLELRPGNPVIVQTPDALDLQTLIQAPPERSVQRVSKSSLQPLSGLASTLALEPQEVDPAFPVWTPNLPAEARDSLRYDPTPTPYTIDRYREALTHPDPYVEAAARYRIAQAHEHLGLNREAAYYYRSVMALDAPWPRDVLPLALARAEIRSGDIDAAREACEQAWGVSRARSEQVATCLGLVSLESAQPAPAAVGRVLANSSGHPLHLLLAAQLLQADGYHAEAQPLLETALAVVAEEDPLRRHILASLGDSYLHQGRLGEASDMWRAVGHAGELGDVVWLRQRMLVMVEAGPGEWPMHLPDLDAFVARGGEGSAEALYLEAQVGETLGDDEAAADALIQLVDHHRRVASANAVPTQLWGVLVRRLEALHRQGRTLDLIAVYRRYYRSSLEDVILDPTPLGLVVEAYDAAGLPEQAMRTQRDLFAIQTRLGQSDPASLLRLARLYEEADRHEDALATLDFLAGQGSPRELEGERQLLLGRVFMSLGQEEEGLAAWERAERTTEHRVEAQLLTALHVANEDCLGATEALEAIVALRPEPGLQPLRTGEAHLVLARCQLELGEAAKAAKSAEEAAGRSPDPHTQRYANFLAAQAARSEGQEPGMLAKALESEEDLWSEVYKGLSEDDAFRAELAARRRGVE